MDNNRKRFSIKRYGSCVFAAFILFGGYLVLLSSCARGEDLSGSDSEVFIPATGEPVTVNFTVGESAPQPLLQRGEASFAPSEGGMFFPPSGESEADVEGADLYLSASLQEKSPSVSLRASLAVGRKARVVAYQIVPITPFLNDTTQLAYADYEVDAGLNLIPDGTPPMTVPSGSVYFVAYSFNDTITMPAFSETILSIGPRDLLWGDTLVNISLGNRNVHIILDHLFSKIELEAQTVLSLTSVIDTIYGVRYAHTFPALTVRSGDLTPGVTGQILVDWLNPGSAPIWSSEKYYVYTKVPPVVNIDSVKIDGITYKDVTPPWTVAYSTQLAAGKDYTLYMRFKATSKFSVYWYRASFGSPGSYPWNSGRYNDETNNYIFPWNTTETDIDVESNIGCVFDGTSSSIGSGTVTPGSSFASGNNTVYPYTFTFNNTNYTTPANYSLKFISNPAEADVTRTFRRGIQEWSRSGGASVSFGYHALTTPIDMIITDNIVWSYWFSNWMYQGAASSASTWIQARVGTGAWGTPASAIQQDDRLLAPEAHNSTYPDPGVLTKSTAFQVNVSSAASGTIINAPSGSALATRSAQLNFSNASGGTISSGQTLSVTQYLPRAYVTQYIGSLTTPQLCVGSTTGLIPSGGGTYTLTVSTNISNLAVRVYGATSLTGNAGILVTANATTQPANDAGGSNVTINVNIPSTTIFRVLSFYFYAPGFTDTKFAEVMQDGGLIGDPGSGVSFTRIYVSGSGDNARLLLTQNPDNLGSYFQFGGVLAWSYGNNSNAIYNPTTSVSNIMSNSWSSGAIAGQTVPHTVANLLLGRGDPCRLLGYTVAQIKEAVANGCAPDNKKYRTPTGAENQALGVISNFSSWMQVSNTWGRWIGPSQGMIVGNRQFLPGNAYCSWFNSSWGWGPTGEQANGPSAQNGTGGYWDATLCATHYQAHFLLCSSRNLSNDPPYGHYNLDQMAAMGVRCVAQ